MARAQLRALGLRAGAVDSRVTRGWLHVVQRGVYAVGQPRLSRAGHLWAAVLACGPHAAISHRSAADHLGLRPSASARIEVTVPTQRRSRRGLLVHNAPLPRAHVTRLDGLPVTTVPRTLLDLAAVLPLDVLRRCFETADRLRVLDIRAVEAVLATANGRRGAAHLAALLDHHLEGLHYTRSDFERDFLALCATYDLPPPVVNHEVEGFEVDTCWPRQRLVIELDSVSFHATRAAMNRDRRRDLVLRLAGWEPVRLTYQQVVRETAATAAALRTLLARAG
ncbi:MAG: DUF559 domain-containing protein [Solirubrobacterales bacterium]|nr:DUF559 domain-containing protein [Solirubrobacterales bacterium]